MSSLLIGIAGGSASGKTTFANDLVRLLPKNSTELIAVDSYYYNNPQLSHKERSLLNYDHPDAFEFSLLVTHLNQLKAGNSVSVPIYDYVLSLRSKTVAQKLPKKIIVIEGILTFHLKELRDLLDLKIFIDTADDLRFERRLNRDIAERGRTKESVYSQWETTAHPMFLEFCLPTKSYADLIIDGSNWSDLEINKIFGKYQDLKF